MHGKSRLIAIGLLLLIVALPAHAYLDPASGSMILQLILGGLAGIAIAVKVFWHKLLGIFGHKKRENDGNSA